MPILSRLYLCQISRRGALETSYDILARGEEQMYFTYYDSPVGPLLLAGDTTGLQVISFPAGKMRHDPKADWRADRKQFAPVIDQLHAYFAGTLTQFDLQLTPKGTPFQLRVWRALQQIPYGKTISYGTLAQAINQPRASRAVGAANGTNPLPIVIPCHRVIGASGALTGFGGGLDVKRWLLNHEGALPAQQQVQRSLCENSPYSKRSQGAGCS